MSQENVERVREAYERWQVSREFDFTLAHPEIELIFIDMKGNPATYHGRRGFEDWLQAVREAWEDLWWEPQRIIDAGDHVVAIVTAHLRGRGSGMDLEVPLGNLWTIRDGMAVRFQMFLRPEDALEAAGLAQ